MAHDPSPPDHAGDDVPESMAHVAPTTGYAMLRVVGLAGSAGSIAALQAFFQAMPADTGMAFVVAPHLSPDGDSVLAELLQSVTSMRVTWVSGGEVMQADHVYVIPPRKGLKTVGGRLRLFDLPADRSRHAAVDHFFRTLADAHGPHATAVILSGSDGALGIKRIKERGGLTLAQDPAEFDGMPRAAIATGLVDWVLPVADMAQRLMDCNRREIRPRTHNAADEALLRDVLDLLRIRSGRDFSCYERATVLRRIGRRMQVNGVDDLDGYLSCLRTRTDEAGALLQDLLISLSNFFRDPDCFAALEASIPELFRDKGPSDILRVWVAACATGEEAYSVAMLMSEYARTLDAPPVVQIFATDLDEDAIQVAREGIYPATIEADVPQERLRRFFVKEHRGYRVRRELREMVLFAMHDLLKDPPFSRLDLVTCRNLLIDLNREAQGRTLDALHFALRPGGTLFLGCSEGVEDGSPLFAVLDRMHRIFRRRSRPRAGLPLPAGPGAVAPVPESPQSQQERGQAARRDFEPGQAGAATGAPAQEAGAAAPLDRQLQLEIERLKSQLRDTIEQHEASTAALKASNRELQSSREELQSINAELTIVNRELKTKVDELGQANSDMHNLMDATAIATVFLDRQLRITRFTPSAVSLFNLITTDVGRPLSDVKSRLRYASLAGDAHQVLETLVSVEREVGEAGGHWYLARLRPYRTLDDRIAGVVLSFVDITERKLAQEALRSADARFRAIVDQATVGVLQVDQQGRIAFANGRMGKLLGYSEQELTGMEVASIVHPDDRAEQRERLQNLLEGGAPYEIEQRLLQRDGSTVWVHNSVSSLPATKRSEGAVIAVCVDITERRNAEAALRNSEEHLRMVLENAREYAIFTTDTERRITGWNLGAERILGYTAQEALGRLADMIFTDQDRAARVPQQEAETAQDEARAGDDRFHQRKDGSLFWASGAMMVMRDGEGRHVGFVKILRDQTAARRDQQALEHSRAALEAANAAKDQFLAVLSHELRTPLTPAVMALQLLSRRKDMPEEAQETLRLIHRNIRIESRLIDDLLDLTRISRGALKVDHEPVDLHQIIRSACEICEPDLREKSQELTLELDAPLCRILGDGHRLQQVVWNLLKNAAKFTPAQGHIKISTAVEDGRFKMAIEDDGVGIDAEALPGIFEAFVQGGAWVAREYGGLGLGLAISRATIEAHGGRLAASSPGRGQGATFTLELPLAEH